MEKKPVRKAAKKAPKKKIAIKTTASFDELMNLAAKSKKKVRD